MSPVKMDDRLPPSLRELWRSDRCEPEERRRAYVRFIWRRRERGTPKRFGYAIAVAFLLGSGLSFAAFATFSPALDERVAPRSAASVPARARVSRHWGTRAFRHAAPPEPAPALSATPQVGETQPPSAASATAVSRAPGERNATPAPSSAANGPPLMPASKSTSAWARAARALREGNARDTEAALREIEASRSTSEAEAAELIRAQLFLKLGRKTEATRLLGTLASRASSPSVQRKAAALLATSNLSAPDRSTE